MVHQSDHSENNYGDTERAKEKGRERQRIPIHITASDIWREGKWSRQRDRERERERVRDREQKKENITACKNQLPRYLYLLLASSPGLSHWYHYFEIEVSDFLIVYASDWEFTG